MSKYFDAIIVLALMVTFMLTCIAHMMTKKQEYDYYIYAKHLIYHQLEDEGCAYIKRIDPAEEE